MDDPRGQFRVDDYRKNATERQPKPVLGVEHVVHILAKGSESPDQVPSPKRCGLWNAPGAQHPPVAAAARELGDPQRNQLALAIDVAAGPYDPRRSGRLERRGGGVERPGQVMIIAVDVGHPLARRAPQTLVERMGLPAVRLRDPPGQPIRVPLYDRDRAVGRAAVDDDVLEVLIPLVEHRTDGPLDEPAVVPARRYDGKFRPQNGSSRQ